MEWKVAWWTHWVSHRRCTHWRAMVVMMVQDVAPMGWEGQRLGVCATGWEVGHDGHSGPRCCAIGGSWWAWWSRVLHLFDGGTGWALCPLEGVVVQGVAPI